MGVYICICSSRMIPLDAIRYSLLLVLFAMFIYAFYSCWCGLSFGVTRCDNFYFVESISKLLYVLDVPYVYLTQFVKILNNF